MISIIPSKPWASYGLLIVALLKEINESMPLPLGDTLVPPLVFAFICSQCYGGAVFHIQKKTGALPNPSDWPSKLQMIGSKK